MKGFKSIFLGLLSTSFFSSALFAGSMGDAKMLSDGWDWTGYYGGLNIGALKYTTSITDINATTFLATLQQTTNPSLAGGFQLGYRYQALPHQISGVYGLELSVHFSDASFRRDYGSSFALYELHAENQLNWLGLLQFMGGIAADRTLLFLSAGLSHTDLGGHFQNTDGIPFFYGFNLNKNHVGTALGGGLEYAFTDRFSARFKADVINPSVYTTSDELGDTFQVSTQAVQGMFGVNYLFG